jgi:hypothetical protein
VQGHERVLDDLLGLLAAPDQHHGEPQQGHVLRPEEQVEHRIAINRRLGCAGV